MAEAILSGVVEGIIGQLAKAAVNQIASLWGVEDDLQQLRDTISTIKSVLVDAEEKQLQHQQIKTWLERLEDAVYEADNLVDEFSTEALGQQEMTGNTIAKQVQIFCSTSNQFAFRYKMGKKIRDVRKKLDAIAADRKFHLEMGLQDTKIVTGEWEEHSFEREENIVGRDDEKKEIIKRLFGKETKENIGVIPIVGVGGLGKSTLAQLVVSDEEVREHFNLIRWVNAPKVFDVKLVVEQIIKSEVKDERSMDELQKDIRKKIEGKKFLLVLDNVWNIQNREKWLKLENLLADCAHGSRIIVTTRDKMIAHIINGREETAYNLKTLNEEKAWSLFKKLAFKQGREPNDLNLVEIGKEIMKKCGGIPLVIRAIASMLYSINFEEWSSFKEKKLSTIQEYDNDIIPRLKLSYDHLPSHLKHCFGYCSLFPKSHVFNVEVLIKLWMAQGFIKLSNDHNQCIEDMGYQHFKDLLYRSFFEVVRFDDDSLKVTRCRMHDCMHDLANSVTGTKCLILSLNDESVDERTRHVSFSFSLDSLQQFQALLVKKKRIRTIFFHNGYKSSARILEKSIVSCKFLRTLKLHCAGLEMIPNSIGKLKHLRYLDLSYNDMKALPNSITRLQNLQTLKLSYCEHLGQIPNDITKLVNLRHLHIESLRGTTLRYMPSGLDQLPNLQKVSLIPPRFCITKRSLDLVQPIPLYNVAFFCHHLSQLKVLNVMGIEDLHHLPDELKCLTSLEHLTISKCSNLDMSNGAILWQHLQSLSELSLFHLPKLVALPQGLQQVTSLRFISIFRCENLEAVLENISNLKWLCSLFIWNCPKLKSLPEGFDCLTSLKRLTIGNCPILLERCREDIGDYWPKICHIKELVLH